ncbi:MAG: hypothetical protein KAG66_21225, partial [Methylococcales bacterium]|nr:hypothetical protein [Methylococcales bacterium]
MNNNQQPPEVKQDIWERTGLPWGILFYALLFVPAAIAVFDEELPVSGRLQVLALTVVVAGWHAGLLYFIKHNPDFRKRPLPILLYISLVLLLWTRLTIIHPVFYIMLFILYGLIFGILTLRYAIPISLILSGLIIYVQVVESGLPFRLNTPLILIYGAMAGAAIIFALWINSIINQSIQRRQLIEELQQ